MYNLGSFSFLKGSDGMCHSYELLYFTVCVHFCCKFIAAREGILLAYFRLGMFECREVFLSMLAARS